MTAAYLFHSRKFTRKNHSKQNSEMCDRFRNGIYKSKSEIVARLQTVKWRTKCVRTFVWVVRKRHRTAKQIETPHHYYDDIISRMGSLVTQHCARCIFLLLLLLFLLHSFASLFRLFNFRMKTLLFKDKQRYRKSRRWIECSRSCGSLRYVSHLLWMCGEHMASATLKPLLLLVVVVIVPFRLEVLLYKLIPYTC